MFVLHGICVSVIVLYLICKEHDIEYPLILYGMVIAVLVAQGTHMLCVVYHRGLEGLDCSLPKKKPQSPLTHRRSTQTSHDALEGQIFHGKEMLQDLYKA